jgi:hypothetical protein
MRSGAAGVYLEKQPHLAVFAQSVMHSDLVVALPGDVLGALLAGSARSSPSPLAASLAGGWGGAVDVDQGFALAPERAAPGSYRAERAFDAAVLEG